MQPTIISEPQQNRHIVLKTILIVVILAVIAGVVVLVMRNVHQANLENTVKTELIKQNKLMKAAAKNNVYSATVPSGVKTTDTVSINVTVSASGTAYCIDGTNKQDAKVVFHMDKSTPDNEPAKGNCSDNATVAPLVPSDVALGSVGAGAVSLTWNKAPYAASYTVQCTTDKAFISELKSQTTTETSITLSDLAGNTQYYCRVAAGNSIGQSAWSSTIEGLTNAVSVLPTELKITTISSTQLHYSWKAVPGAVSYVVEYSPDINFVQDVVQFTTTATSGDVMNLRVYTGYNFHVKAVTAQFDADHASFSEEILGRTAK
ncbi:MAG: hypothetical protein JWN12_34 [Candidatus Saccharibacteria bacterium]|nr:hypothetical protein [Candidatus Saccharibacteria bacterium]